MNTATTLSNAPANAAPIALPGSAPMSPNQRAWARFKRNRLGYASLWLFGVMLLISSLAELVANDRPLLARYQGTWYSPLISNPPEQVFGGDFATPTDWHDPFIRQVFAKPGNLVFFTLIDHSAASLDYFSKNAEPAAPGDGHWLGTDESGRDVLARLIYGFRLSAWFGFALTFYPTVSGYLAAALLIVSQA